jgi:phosphate/sulfate permease
MRKKETTSYLLGMLLNIVGYFIGSNILVQSFSKLFIPKTEYHGYLLWYISGLLIAWAGNVLGILLISPKNIIRTIVGSLVGLAIGLSLSFIPVPLLSIGGIVAIFLGSLIGHYKHEDTLIDKKEET